MPPRPDARLAGSLRETVAVLGHDGAVRAILRGRAFAGSNA